MGASQRISLYLMVYLRVRVWGRCFLQFMPLRCIRRRQPAYIYISFKPGSSESELEAVTALQDCILHINTWMTADKLKLNDDKTELIVIGTRAQLDKISISELSIDHVKVSAVCNVRNLGTWFDNHLSMKTAINNTCQSGLYHLHDIGRIKRFLNRKKKRRLFRQ